MFDIFPDCDVVYEGLLVGGGTVPGLGEELVRRSLEVAEERGCRYAYNVTQCDSSAKMFHRLGFVVGRQRRYADIRHGKETLRDTGNNKTVRIVYKKLGGGR